MNEFDCIMIISNRFVNRKGVVMIYTVTFNPSLDYIVEVDDFKLGMTNRTSYEHMLPGGKVHYNETSLKAIEREIEEEIGYTNLNYKLYFSFQFFIVLPVTLYILPIADKELFFNSSSNFSLHGI